jgi:hypothetical protein
MWALKPDWQRSVALAHDLQVVVIAGGLLLLPLRSGLRFCYFAPIVCSRAQLSKGARQISKINIKISSYFSAQNSAKLLSLENRRSG